LALKKIDLILHPVRFRILRLLGNDSLTTQQISDRLTNVPKSSIYRHLKLLLEGGVVDVAQTQLVHGIQEKTYQLVQPTHLSAGDMAGLSADEHVQYFTTYVMTLLQDFSYYLKDAESAESGIDLLTDRVGYTEVILQATPAELDVFQKELNEAVLKLLKNEPGPGRRPFKLAVIGHPYLEAGPKTDE